MPTRPLGETAGTTSVTRPARTQEGARQPVVVRPPQPARDAQPIVVSADLGSQPVAGDPVGPTVPPVGGAVGPPCSVVGAGAVVVEPVSPITSATKLGYAVHRQRMVNVKAELVSRHSPYRELWVGVMNQLLLATQHPDPDFLWDNMDRPVLYRGFGAAPVDLEYSRMCANRAPFGPVEMVAPMGLIHRGVVKVTGLVDGVSSALGWVSNWQETWVRSYQEAMRPIYELPTSAPNAVAVATVVVGSLGKTAEVAQVGAVFAAGGVAKASRFVLNLFKSRDDDIFTSCQSDVAEYYNSVVDDTELLGAAVQEQLIKLERDGDRNAPRTRHRMCRGFVGLVALGKTQFPQYRITPNMSEERVTFIYQHMHQYLLREARQRDWPVALREDIGYLATCAILPNQKDCEVKKVMCGLQSQTAQEEYAIAGSKYPYYARLLRQLRLAH